MAINGAWPATVDVVSYLARSSCIIVNFLTIAWEAQMLARGDSIGKVIGEAHGQCGVSGLCGAKTASAIPHTAV